MCGIDRPASSAEFAEVETAIGGMRTTMGTLLLEAPEEIRALADAVYVQTRFLHRELVRGDFEERRRISTGRRLRKAYEGLLAACRRSLQDAEYTGPEMELP
ncbi:hypothetical protein GCM10023086_74790 [Streptomyces venetus]|uniref:Uncharacterized protein n=2 Tax=Streptomyces venetus TaxID=1701086 RepID=A0ABP8HI30_9ACTN